MWETIGWSITFLSVGFIIGYFLPDISQKLFKKEIFVPPEELQEDTDDEL